MKNEKNLNKNYLSLAAIMFFAPFVQDLIKNGHLHLDDEDRLFIKSYISYGYIHITVISILIIVSIINFFFTISWINTALTVGIVGLLISLVWGIFCVFSGKMIVNGDTTLIQWKEIEKHNADILKSFIPGYNIYLRYKVGHFDHPYYWLKESLLLWTLYVFVSLISGYHIIASIVLILIITRIVFLIGGIDILYDHIKQFFHGLFSKNIEELWAYPKGCILWLYQSILKRSSQDIKAIIEEEKQPFQTLNSYKKNTSILSQYIILSIILIIYTIQLFITTSWEFITVAQLLVRALIIGRYGIMIWFKALPNIPVFYELSEGIISLRGRIKNRSS